MMDSFHGAISTPYLTPNKGSGFPRHLGTPPNGLARPPPPPSLPVEQDNTTPGKTTEDSTRHAVDSLLQSAVKKGSTTLYNWCEVSGPRGIAVEDKWYVGGKAVCLRPAMVILGSGNGGWMHHTQPRRTAPSDSRFYTAYIAWPNGFLGSAHVQ